MFKRLCITYLLLFGAVATVTVPTAMHARRRKAKDPAKQLRLLEGRFNKLVRSLKRPITYDKENQFEKKMRRAMNLREDMYDLAIKARLRMPKLVQLSNILPQYKSNKSNAKRRHREIQKIDRKLRKGMTEKDYKKWDKKRKRAIKKLMRYHKYEPQLATQYPIPPHPPRKIISPKAAIKRILGKIKKVDKRFLNKGKGLTHKKFRALSGKRRKYVNEITKIGGTAYKGIANKFKASAPKDLGEKVGFSFKGKTIKYASDEKKAKRLLAKVKKIDKQLAKLGKGAKHTKLKKQRAKAAEKLRRMGKKVAPPPKAGTSDNLKGLRKDLRKIDRKLTSRKKKSRRAVEKYMQQRAKIAKEAKQGKDSASTAFAQEILSSQPTFSSTTTKNKKGMSIKKESYLFKGKSYELRSKHEDASILMKKLEKLDRQLVNPRLWEGKSDAKMRTRLKQRQKIAAKLKKLGQKVPDAPDVAFKDGHGPNGPPAPRKGATPATATPAGGKPGTPSAATTGGAAVAGGAAVGAAAVGGAAVAGAAAPQKKGIIQKVKDKFSRKKKDGGTKDTDKKQDNSLSRTGSGNDMMGGGMGMDGMGGGMGQKKLSAKKKAEYKALKEKEKAGTMTQADRDRITHIRNKKKDIKEENRQMMMGGGAMGGGMMGGGMMGGGAMGGGGAAMMQQNRMDSAGMTEREQMAYMKKRRGGNLSMREKWNARQGRLKMDRARQMGMLGGGGMGMGMMGMGMMGGGMMGGGMMGGGMMGGGMYGGGMGMDHSMGMGGGMMGGGMMGAGMMGMGAGAMGGAMMGNAFGGGSGFGAHDPMMGGDMGMMGGGFGSDYDDDGMSLGKKAAIAGAVGLGALAVGGVAASALSKGVEGVVQRGEDGEPILPGTAVDEDGNPINTDAQKEADDWGDEDSTNESENNEDDEYDKYDALWDEEIEGAENKIKQAAKVAAVGTAVAVTGAAALAAGGLGALATQPDTAAATATEAVEADTGTDYSDDQWADSPTPKVTADDDWGDEDSTNESDTSTESYEDNEDEVAVPTEAPRRRRRGRRRSQDTTEEATVTAPTPQSISNAMSENDDDGTEDDWGTEASLSEYKPEEQPPAGEPTNAVTPSDEEPTIVDDEEDENKEDKDESPRRRRRRRR